METEFNLSEKILDLYALQMEDEGMSKEAIAKEDVKEFIKRLKERFLEFQTDKEIIFYNSIIDKLAGDKLI